MKLRDRTSPVDRLDAAAGRARRAQDELADAIAELEHAICSDGWVEVIRHSSAGEVSVVYQRATATVDPITGWPADDVEIRTFDAFTQP